MHKSRAMVKTNVEPVTVITSPPYIQPLPPRADLRDVKREVKRIFEDMTFWERVKFFFTGKQPVKKKPALDLSKVAKGTLLASDNKPLFKATYETFAGCDISCHIGDSLDVPDRNPAVYARAVVEKKQFKSVPSVQMIQFETAWENKPNDSGALMCTGKLISILFGESALKDLDRNGKRSDLVLKAASEDGQNIYIMVLPSFRVIGSRWAISVDDLVSEEEFHFEADYPVFWTKVEKPVVVVDEEDNNKQQTGEEKEKETER
jgi:hypothetical protein